VRIVVVGGGEIGFELSRQLSRHHGLSVIDCEAAVEDRFRGLDVAFLVGSGTSADVLERAGIAEADYLIACTGLDEVNMVACAIASRLGVERTICFVSREDFVGNTSAEAVRSHFGIERIIWPEAQLAAEIERIIGAPGAIDAESFADGRIRLLEFRLSEASPLTKGPLAALGLPRGALVVALIRQNVVAIPRGDTILRAGDKIFVMGRPEALADVGPRIRGSAEGPATQLVTIIGGGDVGFRLAQRLDSSSDIEVRVIESNPRRGEALAAALRRALVLLGDGTDLELLETEDVGRSDVLVSVVDNDERNLLASLLGRQLGVRRIITRVSRPANLRLFERVGIDVALSARGAAVTSLVHDIQGGRTRLLAVLEEGRATILELQVPAGFEARALMAMNPPPQSIVGAILRGDEVIIPRGPDEVRPHDRLIVFTAAEAVDRVRDYFGAS
jgi:trk system potassium uptake protein TrkA